MLTSRKIFTFLPDFCRRLFRHTTLKVTSAAALDIGLGRDNNEDSYLSLPDLQLWAVADGMGGCDGGEIASAIAITHLKNAIVAGESLVVAIEQCHQAICLAAKDGFGVSSMGSTIVVMQIVDHQYQIAWIGDSRAYHYRTNLTCLSKDHSYIQLLLDQNLITEAEIENHPYKNAITQALGGTGESINVDLVTGEVQADDIFLLCSDGLSGAIANDDIAQVLSSQETTLAEKTSLLIAKALAAGGEDNIAVVVIGIGSEN